MVQLTLYSPKGNQGVRYYPYTGYLGLTPLKVEGAVSTRVDSDGKLLPAKSIVVSVRCYETRMGRLGAIQTNILADHSQVLWSKPSDCDVADIGDMEFPFKITVPADSPGWSTSNFQEYRVFWRVEAVLHHIHIAGVGSRQIKHFDLALLRYDISSPPSHLPLTSSSLQLNHITSKSRAHMIRYHIFTPLAPVGPLDLVSILLYLQPIDPTVSIRSASLIVERRIQLNETHPTTLPSPQQPYSLSANSRPHSSPQSRPQASSPQSVNISPAYYPQSPYAETSNSTNHSSLQSLSPGYNSLSSPPSPTLTPTASSVFTDSDQRPLLPESSSTTAVISPTVDVPSKTISSSVVGTESSGRFNRDETGLWTKTLTFQWPTAKSNARWAMGETMQTTLACVKFFARIKIVVSSPAGTESIDLDEEELFIVSTNDAERQLAMSKFGELQNSKLRSKSKSPRRSRLQRDQELEPLPTSLVPPAADTPLPPLSSVGGGQSFIPYALPSPTPSPSRLSSSPSKTSSSSRQSISSGKMRIKSIKRPHTSAGPRDKSSYSSSQNPADNGYRELVIPPRPETAIAAGSGVRERFSMRRPSTNTGISSTLAAPALRSKIAGSSSRSMEPLLNQGHVRAWEEELARIEAQSRRSSEDMLGFSRRRAAEPCVVGR